MKKIMFIASIAICSTLGLKAQENKTQEVTAKNAWFKIGVVAGAPVGQTSNNHNIALGLDVKGQVMQTGHFGFGLASGYTHYFAKENQTDLGVIPAGVMLRYYPKTQGIFLGTDAGYSFVTTQNFNGGMYINPQIGYHNRDWNIYGYYNHTFNNVYALRNAGVGISYNLRLGKK